MLLNFLVLDWIYPLPSHNIQKNSEFFRLALNFPQSWSCKTFCFLQIASYQHTGLQWSQSSSLQEDLEHLPSSLCLFCPTLVKVNLAVSFMKFLAHSGVTLPLTLLAMMMAGSIMDLNYSYLVLNLFPLEQSY